MIKISWEKLKTASDKHNNIVIFGAGEIGTQLCSLLSKMGIHISSFVDNNVQKQRQKFCGIKCIALSELSTDLSSIVIIAVGNMDAYSNIYKCIKNAGLMYIADMYQIIDDIIINDEAMYKILLENVAKYTALDLYWTDRHSKPACLKERKCIINSTEDRIAVYTGIFGKYDEIHESVWSGENVDFFCISDEETDQQKLKKTRWIDAKTVIPDYITGNKEKNRYIKMHSDQIFAGYRYTLYIDGRVQIVSDVRNLFEKSVTGISCFLHPIRKCIYKEAVACVALGLVSIEQILPQIEEYRAKRMPANYGLPEMMVIGLDQRNKVWKKLFRDWEKEFEKYPYRDQISFPYVMWKNGIKMSDMGIAGADIRQSELFKIYAHNHERHDV